MPTMQLRKKFPNLYFLFNFPLYRSNYTLLEFSKSGCKALQTPLKKFDLEFDFHDTKCQPPLPKSLKGNSLDHFRTSGKLQCDDCGSLLLFTKTERGVSTSVTHSQLSSCRTQTRGLSNLCSFIYIGGMELGCCLLSTDKQTLLDNILISKPR